MNSNLYSFNPQLVLRCFASQSSNPDAALAALDRYGLMDSGVAFDAHCERPRVLPLAAARAAEKLVVQLGLIPSYDPADLRQLLDDASHGYFVRKAEIAYNTACSEDEDALNVWDDGVRVLEERGCDECHE